MANIKKLSKTEYVPKQILLAEDVKSHAEKTNEVIDVVNTNTASINTTLNKLNDIIESNRVLSDEQYELNQKVVSIDASITDINDIIENLEVKDYDASIANLQQECRQAATIAANAHNKINAVNEKIAVIDTSIISLQNDCARNTTISSNNQEDIKNINSHIQLTDSSINAIETKISNITKPAVYYGTNDIDKDEEIYDKNGNKIDAKEGDIYICIPEDGDYLKGKTYIRFKLRNTLCWAAMAGNVNAENVYFPNGISRDVAFGSATSPTTKIVECKGKNLKELLEYYTTTDKMPDNIAISYKYNSPQDWSISYDSSYPLITDLNITYQDENGEAQTVKTEDYYEVGTVFTLPSQSYKIKPEINSPIYPITFKNNTGTQKFPIGPSSISGLTYGFWLKDSSNNYTSDNIINANRIEFEQNYSGIKNIIHTQRTCTATFEYITDSDAQIHYSITGAFNYQFEGVKYTPNDNNIITTDAITFTLNDEGDAIISMQVKNNSRWKRTLSNNTIPQSNTIIIATKHQNYQIDGSLLEMNAPEKTVVPVEEEKGAPYPTLQDMWTFTAHGVYPTFRYAANDETATKWQWRKMPLRNYTKENYKSVIFSKTLANLTNDNATLHVLQLQIPELYITKDDGNLASIEYSEDDTTWQAINDIDYDHYISTQNPITGGALPINYVVFTFAGKFTLDTLFRFKF